MLEGNLCFAFSQTDTSLVAFVYQLVIYIFCKEFDQFKEKNFNISNLIIVCGTSSNIPG